MLYVIKIINAFEIIIWCNIANKTFPTKNEISLGYLPYKYMVIYS